MPVIRAIRKRTSDALYLQYSLHLSPYFHLLEHIIISDITIDGAYDIPLVIQSRLKKSERSGCTIDDPHSANGFLAGPFRSN